MSFLSDELNENSSNIVDCDVLEAAKENVQPLATGRRVTALSAILATPHAQREAKLSATRNRLRINVELALDDEDDDPLEAYCRLVNWTVENYPQGHSAESGLLELLEEATRVLKDDRGGKWRRDLKYLKLWLLYASYVEKPTIIYKFLIANDIGTEFALLYEEHAAVLERDGRRNEADAAYALGIARKATPLDHLESRYEDFQKRMMSNIMRAPAPTVASSSSQPPRKALATTASSLPVQTSRTSSSRTTQPSTSGTPSAASNSRLQIFVDPTGAQAQAAEDGANEWTDLGTRKTRIKENVPEVKKLAGATIKQAGRSKRLAAGSGSGGAGSSAASKIVPFRDPAPGEMPPPPAPAPRQRAQEARAKPPAVGFVPFADGPQEPATPKFTPFRDESAAASSATVAPISESIMKLRTVDKKISAPTTEAEALRKDPLKNYGDESVASTEP
ncbi:other/BUB protein kinase [Pholiota molesta]|nr:other/BUB protein kinase [Pholiota molesta]